MLNQDDLNKFLDVLDIDTKSKHYDGHSWIQCPFLHNGKRDKNPSMSIRYENDALLFYCASCHQGWNHITLAKQITNNNHDAIEMVKKALAKDLDYYIQEEYKQSLAKKKKDPYAHIQKIYDDFDELPEEIFDFLCMDRGIAPNIIVKSKPRHDPIRKRIIFPILDSKDKIIGLNSRASDPDNPSRWENMLDFEKSKYLYHLSLPKLHDYLIVVEGVSDVLKMASFGFLNTVGIFGSRASDTQIEKLIFYEKKIAIMLDRDDAGKKGSALMLKQLKDYCQCIEVRNYNSSDPGDISEDNAKEVFNKVKNKLKII